MFLMKFCTMFLKERFTYLLSFSISHLPVYLKKKVKYKKKLKRKINLIDVKASYNKKTKHRF